MIRYESADVSIFYKFNDKYNILPIVLHFLHLSLNAFMFGIQQAAISG